MGVSTRATARSSGKATEAGSDNGNTATAAAAAAAAAATTAAKRKARARAAATPSKTTAPRPAAAGAAARSSKRRKVEVAVKSAAKENDESSNKRRGKAAISTSAAVGGPSSGGDASDDEDKSSCSSASVSDDEDDDFMSEASSFSSSSSSASENEPEPESEPESDFEITRRAPPSRRGRSRAPPAAASRRRLGKASATAESSREDEEANRAARPVAEKMPVFGDMKLQIAPLPPIIEEDEEEEEEAGDRGSAAKKGNAKYHYKFKGADTESSSSGSSRKKRGKTKAKTVRELLTGDISDAEELLEGLVDPRELPEDHIDYSRYSGLFVNHPHLRHAWSSLKPTTASSTMGRIEQPESLRIQLLPFQQEGVWWMAKQEQSSIFRGGILADEMGMGKTLQTIALMLTNRGGPTLVVCPTVALLQWKAEIEAATDALSVTVFYGSERKKLLDESSGKIDSEQLAKHDVVLTTYAVMESGFRRERTGFRLKGMLRTEPSALHSVEWFRVVLDEAHNLKDRSSNSARAAFELTAQRVWSLTGTPLHNRVGELYSLIRLTKSDPFSMYFCHSCTCKSLHWNFSQRTGKYCTSCGCMYTRHFCYWNMHILKPIQQNPASSLQSRVGFRKLGRLLDNIMLRRTKVERADDLELPPRIVVTRRDKFSPEEEDLYVSLFSDYQREFDTYAMHGTVLNNYANIFELITRMRLAANHPDLLRLKVDAAARVGCDSTDTLVCAICNEEAEDPVLSRCKHVFCRTDAQMFISSGSAAGALRCPMCYAVLDIDLTQPDMRAAGGSKRGARNSDGSGATLMETMLSTPRTTEYRRSIVNRIDMKRWRSSTKIEALVEELSRHRRANANVKSIVFSQFVSFLDLIQWRLNRAGFSVCRLDGRMSPSQRDAVIRTFMTQPEYTVFLVSLKAGGVALNLTEASNVYLADCWWNPSVEVQAMDRIHRMGQRRPIKVTRIIVENSIESRIVALQVKKQMLVNSTIGRDSKSLDQLSQQDMQFLFSS
ncbi:DNA repair protein rad16 [Coemansia sp. RSA 1939]|nr:DNA repair protein rad16 [Coemansia sp. RSA 1939]KAJ2615700.1 DNA repair protein rad16 [Coemansia sp. RSA 1804]